VLSWSWCGWPCVVEPQSLYTGFEYLNGVGACRHRISLRTRLLVNWQLCLEQAGESVDVVEAGLLERCRTKMPDEPEPFFTHEFDKETQFRYLVRIKSEPTFERIFQPFHIYPGQSKA
jgi:hypothetical protein